MANGIHVADKQGNADSMMPMSRGDFSRRIVIISDPAVQHGLDTILESAGYQVSAFEQSDAIPSICGECGEPAAVIIDSEFKQGKNVLARTLAEMQVQCNNSIPVIFLSPRKDIAAKLAAYRAGATHYLDKPVDPASLLRMLAESAQTAPAQAYRVMLVDDESGQQAAYAQLLSEAGMEVRVLNDPLLLHEALDSFAADVLVLGMEMTLCTGPELAVILHDEQRYAAIPIVFLSSESELLLQIQAVNCSNENYLSRLVAPSHMIGVISSHARNYRHNLEHEKVLFAARYELERQQQALDAHAIVSMADLNGNIVYVNDKFCQISGYSSEELIGKNHRIIKSAQHPPELYAEMWHTISGGKIWQGEVCNRSKSGSLYWVNTSIVPFLDAEGLPYQYISIRTDITHVKESELRLNRSQAFANIGTWDWNIRTGELIWSERIAPLFGYPQGNLQHNYESFLNAIYPDDLLMVSNAIKACVEDGISYNIEHRCVWPDGSLHWLLQRGDVVRESNGMPLHMLGMVQDVTQRKLAELALLESSARLEEAQNLAKLGNWEADMASGELYWSDEIYRIFGQDKTSFTPTVETFSDAIHPDDLQRVQESEQRAAVTGFHDVVHRIIRPDGSVRYVHELARSQCDAAGRMVSLRGTVQDVTELKLAEQAMLQAKEAAEAASRAKSEFLASMSHELRTPLNAILGFSQLFSMDDQLPQKTRENSLQIEHAGQHLLSLVNDLIDLARIESNKIELSMEPVKVNGVVKDSLSMVKSMAFNRGIKVILVHCGVMDITVWADFNRLRQALINLLTNAIKYNKPGGTVHLVCEVNEGRARIAVTDTGTGIPMEMQARMFNAFDRLGEERGDVEGTGIGLVITKRIMEAMGGSIGFESAVEQGSTFWLEIPLTVNNERVAQEPAAVSASVVISQDTPPTLTGRPLVLYIEDNPMNLRLMQQIFAGKKEWELRSATTAESGIEMARANPPALILMDINLPGMDGYKALSLLKSHPETARIPVIALTANAMKGDREHGMDAGFADYLTKPLDILKLLGLLGDLLK